MALSNHGYVSTLDITANTTIYDYSPVFFRAPIPGGEMKLWPILRKREDLYDTVCRWYEDSDLPITVTAHASSGALTTADGQTTLVLASGEASRAGIRVGALLRDRAAGQDEVVLVTAVAGDNLTIQRAFGQTDSSSGDRHAHANGATWEIIGYLNPEGSVISTGQAANLTERTNYTSILDTTVELTRTQMRRRMQPNGGSPWDFQVERAVRKFERMLELHVIWSRGTQRAATPVYGSMAGIIDIIQDRAGNNISTASQTFTYEVFDDAMRALYENGYDETTNFVLLVPPVGKQAAAYIHESAMRAPYASTTTRGLVATHLMSTFGHEVPIIATPRLLNDQALILNVDKVTVRFMDTLLAYDVPLGTLGTDKALRRFISEFSLELHNADTAHYLWAGGLSWS